jgi:hypothetical protein
MDQGRQAGGALDAAVVTPLPGQRGAAPAENACLQLGESVAPTRTTEADRQLVADHSPAAPRQNGWAAGQALTVLLAHARREPPDPTPVWLDAAADLALPIPTG